MPFTAEVLKAVQENDTNSLRNLITNGEDINQRGTLKGQAEEIGLLEVAIQSKAHRVALLLLSKDIEWKNELSLNEYCTLHNHTEFGDYYHLGKAFWDACALNDLKSAQELHATALEMNLYVLDYISSHPHIHSWDYQNQTAAHFCAKYGYKDILSWLLTEMVQHEANNPNAAKCLSIQNNANETPLEVAILCNQTQIVKIILQLNANNKTILNKEFQFESHRIDLNLPSVQIYGNYLQYSLNHGFIDIYKILLSLRTVDVNSTATVSNDKEMTIEEHLKHDNQQLRQIYSKNVKEKTEFEAEAAFADPTHQHHHGFHVFL